MTLTPSFAQQEATIKPLPQPFTPILATKSIENPTPIKIGNVTEVSTATIQPDARLTINCLPISQGLPSNTTVTGTIVLVEKLTGQPHFWNMDTGEETFLPVIENVIIRDFNVSPDGKWLAYLESRQDENYNTVQQWVSLLSLDGQQKGIPVDIELSSISRWLDNEQLILRKGVGVGAIAQVVVNPFTKQQKKLRTDFPDLYNLTNFDWQNQSIIVYDPTLTRVAYARIPADIVLMDAQDHRTLAEISPVPLPHAVPKWSPDGQEFVFANTDLYNGKNWEYELYRVDRDGQIEQLTHLTTYYRTTYILSYTWSPDGRYIAFWLAVNPSQPPERVSLLVMNVATQDVVNYCIDSSFKGYFPPPLFWSPNSRQLVAELAEGNEETSPHTVIVVDINNNWAAQIAENFLIPVGWMVAP